jgi:hypothetical protein
VIQAVAFHGRGASLKRNDGTGGCYLCDYGLSGACVHPAVRGQKPQESFDAARQPHGPCGPEAHYLDFEGLYWPGDRR